MTDYMFYEQIPELDFEIPAEAQRGTLSTVTPQSPISYWLFVLIFAQSSGLLSLVCLYLWYASPFVALGYSFACFRYYNFMVLLMLYLSEAM